MIDRTTARLGATAALGAILAIAYLVTAAPPAKAAPRTVAIAESSAAWPHPQEMFTSAAVMSASSVLIPLAVVVLLWLIDVVLERIR